MTGEAFYDIEVTPNLGEKYKQIFISIGVMMAVIPSP